MTYVAPTIPPAPQPQPLGASPTAEQVTAFQSAMNLYLRREEYLSQHRARWDEEQYRQWYMTVYLPDQQSTAAASTAAQQARADAEQRAADAGLAAAAAQRHLADIYLATSEVPKPPPVIQFPGGTP